MLLLKIRILKGYGNIYYTLKKLKHIQLIMSSFFIGMI